ncbi:MAG: Rieske (2Fe-2S) protein [bacterium]
MSDDRQPPELGACTECASSGRRDFLLDALRAGAMALAAIGLAPGGANAMPPRLISALASHMTDKSYPIPAADGVQIDGDSEVILSRAGKQVYALVLACPHQNTALKWDAENKRFQCPKHKSRYRPDGTFIEGRATRSMDRYAIRVAGNTVIVDIDKVYQEDLAKGQWQQAVVALP